MIFFATILFVTLILLTIIAVIGHCLIWVLIALSWRSLSKCWWYVILELLFMILTVMFFMWAWPMVMNMF